MEYPQRFYTQHYGENVKLHGNAAIRMKYFCWQHTQKDSPSNSEEKIGKKQITKQEHEKRTE